MNKTIKVATAVLVPTIVVWMLLGFILWNWNPQTWGELQRATYVWLSLVAAILSVGFFGGIV